MNALVILVASLIVGTKILDCWSTWIKIKGIESEQNPLARGLMSRIGARPAIGVILLIEIVSVLFATWMLFEFFDQFASKLLFVVVGIVLTVVQTAVAHANYFGRPNLFTIAGVRVFRRIFG